MKRVLLFLTFLALTTSVWVSSQSRQVYLEPQGQTLILRVTSASPQEELTFEASYLFRTPDSPLQHVEQKTPYEIKMASDYVTGIFRKKTGRGELRVELLSHNGTTELPQVATSGEIIVLGTDISRTNKFYIQAVAVPRN